MRQHVRDLDPQAKSYDCHKLLQRQLWRRHRNCNSRIAGKDLYHNIRHQSVEGSLYEPRSPKFVRSHNVESHDPNRFPLCSPSLLRDKGPVSRMECLPIEISIHSSELLFLERSERTKQKALLHIHRLDCNHPYRAWDLTLRRKQGTFQSHARILHSRKEF